LQRAAILSNEKFRGVTPRARGQSAEDHLHEQRAGRSRGGARDRLQGRRARYWFNINYLLDVLQNTAVEKVEFAFGDANSSALVTVPERDDYKYVVMPMRI
jgi:DNA polymerase-3 subunit beta